MIFKMFKKITDPIKYFVNNEASSGIILLVCAVIAIAIANSPMRLGYADFLHHTITIGYKDFSLSMSVLHWINDGLMAIFFFVVGMEIKRELVIGELNSTRKALLPIAAAFGGMIVPAAIYLLFNYNKPTVLGWGIPMSTDIAFALGILSLVGNKRAPSGIIVFLTALAIVDDLGAILVIAVFYTNQISLTALFMALIILSALMLANKLRINFAPVFIILGIILWVVLLKSGIHSTIAGVLLAMTIPVEKDNKQFKTSMLYQLEHLLTPWSSFLIMPIFALANAGVLIEAHSVSNLLTTPVGIGILLGLFIGKQIGISGTSLLLVKLKIAKLPAHVTLKHIYAASLLGGIGFTMSLFVSSLSFESEELLSVAKLSILSASVLSAIAGILVFKSIKVSD